MQTVLPACTRPAPIPCAVAGDLDSLEATFGRHGGGLLAPIPKPSRCRHKLVWSKWQTFNRAGTKKFEFSCFASRFPSLELSKATEALSPPSGSTQLSKRGLLAVSGSILLFPLCTSPGAATEQTGQLAAALQTDSTTKSTKAEAPADTSITDRVYLDFELCPTAFRQDRTLGEPSLICDEGEPMGRVVIGLYGNQVPQTVENFKAMVKGTAGSSYKGTIVHKVLQGQYFLAGRQGPLEKGEVVPPSKLARNRETIDGGSFRLQHNRPGTVSLSLGTNDDEEDRKLDAEYRNVEFLITTGPGPAPQLDNGNIVFGTVLQGMDVVGRIASVPTYKPSDRIRQFNDFAQFLGDDRASKGRTSWNRPLKTIVIRDCGLVT